MIAFEIQLNGERISVAGVDNGVLSTVITWVKRAGLTSTYDELSEVEDEEELALPEEELTLHVGGYARNPDSVNFRRKWVNRDLQVGDEICIKVTQVAQVDPPMQDEQENPDLLDQQKRQYYEQLRREYSDDLLEQTEEE